MKKSNAMRYLDTHEIMYNTLYYEYDEESIDGISVATKLGRSVELVYKTIVLKGDTNHYVALLPVEEHLNLKTLAKIVGERSIQMVPVKDINKLTGYVRGACSPFAMKKDFPVIIHEEALCHSMIVVSSGSFGQQIEMDPRDLILLRSATIENIIK